MFIEGGTQKKPLSRLEKDTTNVDWNVKYLGDLYNTALIPKYRNS